MRTKLLIGIIIISITCIISYKIGILQKIKNHTLSYNIENHSYKNIHNNKSTINTVSYTHLRAHET